MIPKRFSWIRPVALGLGELLVLAGLWLGIRHETQAVNLAVSAVSELRDPSPFRAALMGHLGKIHLGLEGYLLSPDPSLEKQVDDSRNDFEALLPDFVKQNPKLFPQTAAEEIRRTFSLFKDAIDRTLEDNTRRMVSRGVLEQNFTRILYLIDHDLRPLIRKEQADGDERREAVLNIENLARAWHDTLVQSWAQPSESAKAITFENDNRGQTYLERYSRMELLPRERKVLREVRALWTANSDLARESFIKENLVIQAEKAMDGERAQVIATLNQYLPAMPPAELEAKKQSLFRTMHLHMAATFTLGIIGLASLIATSLVAYRLTRRSTNPSTPLADGIFRVPRPTAMAQEAESTTLEMDLKGTITAWSSAAEGLYGYSAKEMRGQSIGKLFESESEIGRLGQELQAAKRPTFETTHKTKAGAAIPVRIEFRPVSDIAIGLICSRVTLIAVLALGAFLLGACGLLYTNIRVPYSYNAPTPADVHTDKEDPVATGRACNRSLVYLVAWGNAGFASAVQNALEPYPKATLYDVKTDVKVTSYLVGLYTQTCTIVTGRVAK